MSRIITCGLETTPVAEAGYGTFEGQLLVGAGAAVTKETTIKRSGVACHAHDSGASNATVYTRFASTPVAGYGYYVRCYFRVSALPDGNDAIMRVQLTSGNYNLAKLRANGKIYLTDPSAVQIGSDSAATVAAGTWYRLEMFGKTGAGATDAGELRLDGVTVASYTGANYTDLEIDRFDFGWIDAPGASKFIYIDDCAVNNDQGATQNSWPGEGQIVYLDAISDNARTGNWVAGAGGTTNLFAAVDNDPPAGVASGSATDTSQIKNTSSDLTGNYDANMESYTTAGLTAADAITLIQPIVAHSRVTGNVTAALHIVSNPAGTEQTGITWGGGATAGTYPTNWVSALWGTPIYAPSVTLGTAPVLRVGRRDSSANEAHIAGMRIAVEYVTVAGQQLRPDADTVTTGWTATPLWNKVEEAVADGTVITSTAS